MNKKFIHTLNNKLPIISIIILTLVYIYLSIPEDYTIQIGGELAPNMEKLPKNTPFIYTYRWIFVIIPILIIGVIINSFVYSNNVVVDMWDMANAFFYNFAKQDGLAKAAGYKINLSTDPADLGVTDPDMIKYINYYKISTDIKGGVYPYAQFFCSSYRPCSCCLERSYYNWLGPSASKTCKKALTPSSS